MILSGGRLNFCQCPPTTCILEVFFSQYGKLRQSSPRIWHAPVLVDIQIVVDALFLHHVQIIVSGSSYIDILQRDRECFFFRHIQLNSRMTIDEVTMNRPKISACFNQSSFGSVGWDSSDSPRRSPLSPALLSVCSRLRVGSGNSQLPNNFAVPSATGNLIFISSQKSRLLMRWSFEGKSLKRPLSPVYAGPQSQHLLSRFHPRWMHTQGKCLVRLACQIDEVLIDLVLISDGIRPLLQTELLVLRMILRIAFHREFSVAFHGISPPLFFQSRLQ